MGLDSQTLSARRREATIQLKKFVCRARNALSMEHFLAPTEWSAARARNEWRFAFQALEKRLALEVQ